MQFTANAVGILESQEDNHLTVVLADDEETPEHVLQLSAALRWDDQDRALGMATYSITIDAAATTYGGVERCELTQAALALLFSEAASRVLGIDRDVLVTLSLVTAQHAALGAVLSRIFAPELPGAPELVIGDA